MRATNQPSDVLLGLIRDFMSAAITIEHVWENGSLAEAVEDLSSVKEKAAELLYEGEPWRAFIGNESVFCPVCMAEDEVVLIDVMERHLRISLHDPTTEHAPRWDVADERSILDTSTTVAMQCGNCDTPFPDEMAKEIAGRWNIPFESGKWEAWNDILSS